MGISQEDVNETLGDKLLFTIGTADNDHAIVMHNRECGEGSYYRPSTLVLGVVDIICTDCANESEAND